MRKQTTVEMKLEGEGGKDGDQRCLNKAHGAERARRIQGAIAGVRSGGITKTGKGDAQPRGGGRGRRKWDGDGREKGKLREREKEQGTSDLCWLYNFPQQCPPPPSPRLSYPSRYLTPTPGCAPPHCRTEEGSPATPAMIKILP